MIRTLMRFGRVVSGPRNSVPKLKNVNSRLKIGKILYGFILVFSLFLANSILSGYGQLSFAPKAQEASAQLGPLPGLFGNPGSSDFLSLAVAIMPTIQGADLNVSNVAGSTNCDLLVPVTYIDGGCMSSLPLLTPFTVQPNVTQPVNETAFVDYNYSQPSTLGVSIGLSSDNITAGETQTVTVTVSDENSTEPISGAYITSNITDSYGTSLNDYTGTTDDTGQTSFDYAVPADALSDFYEVLVTATADGYDNATASTTFEVIGSDYDSLYDNSTSDDFNYDDGNYDYDDGSSSSDDNNDYDSPTVKSVDPNDGQDNVPLNTEIKVTFDEKMDQDTLDDGSLDIFCETTCDIDNVGVNADPSSKSVTYTLDRQLEPGTRYEAQLDFNVQDDNGNYLDCSNSNDVDSSCTWQFTTTGNGNANIELNPTSGPIGDSVHFTGSGFDPNHEIIVTFKTFETIVVKTISSNNNGEFSGDFIVPISLPGAHDVAATDGSNSDTVSFTVTSTPPDNPVILIDPSSGPVNTQVDIAGAGFDPSSSISIKFNDTDVDTTPDPVETDTNGIFFANFTVPDSTIGQQIVKATDEGSNSASTTYTVTLANTPAANQLRISPSNVNSIESISNQTEGSNASNATTAIILNESNTTKESLNDTTPESHSGLVNQSNSSSSPESGSKVPAPATNDTEPVRSVDSLDSTANNESPPEDSISQATDNQSPPEDSISQATDNQSPPEDSISQATDNQSSSSDTKSVSSSLDDTKSNSQFSSSDGKSDVNSVGDEKPHSKDLEQDRKDRELFEKYLRGDHAESKQEENRKPVAVNDEAKTMQDTPVTIAILSNDKDPDNDKLKIMGVSPPQKGKIETNDDGSIVYSPEKSWAGKEVFSYTVGDGNGGIATATVQVEVQPAINHEPRAIDDTISGNENTPEKIVLKAEDPDNGDKLAFKIVEKPSHGKIAEFSSEKGNLVYLPDKDYQGKDGFKFIVTDGIADSKEGKITIEVKPGRNLQEGQQQADQSQQEQQQQQQQQEQDKSSKSDEKRGSSNDGSSGDKPKSDDSKGDQSEDQKQQDQKEEPKDEQKQEEPKAEEKSSDGGNDSGTSS